MHITLVGSLYLVLAVVLFSSGNFQEQNFIKLVEKAQDLINLRKGNTTIAFFSRVSSASLLKPCKIDFLESWCFLFSQECFPSFTFKFRPCIFCQIYPYLAKRPHNPRNKFSET